MGIDYGDKRIGISLTDSLNIIASPYLTLKNDNNIFLNILDICKEKNVGSIIIGMPLNKNDEIGFAAKKVIKFMNSFIEFSIKEGLKLDFYEQDENFSTKYAYETMKNIKVKNKNQKNIIDSIASANILKEFMASKKKIIYDFEKYKDIV